MRSHEAEVLDIGRDELIAAVAAIAAAFGPAPALVARLVRIKLGIAAHDRRVAAHEVRKGRQRQLCIELSGGGLTGVSSRGEIKTAAVARE